MYILCCIWYSVWIWTYSVNWELLRMLFIWLEFLLLVLWDNSNFCQSKFWLTGKRWRLLVELKFIPLSFLIACFHWKFRKTWCLSEKCIAMNPEKHEVSLFQFHFGSALQYLDCFITNIQWSKQPPHTCSCLWNLHFLSVCLLFLERLSLFLF